ncbi:MAG: hypothetical protein Q4B52_01805 [Tissierellia bacterium]|nr:hypothetical protein [Tissierellia bacterium]
MEKRTKAYWALFLYLLSLFLNIQALSIGIFGLKTTNAMSYYATAIYPASLSYFVMFTFLLFEGVFFLKYFGIIKWKKVDRYIKNKAIDYMVWISLCDVFYMFSFHTNHNLLAFLCVFIESVVCFLMLFNITKADREIKKMMPETFFMFTFYYPWISYLSMAQFIAFLSDFSVLETTIIEAIINILALVIIFIWINIASQNTDKRIYFSSVLIVFLGVLVRIATKLNLAKYHPLIAIVLMVLILISIFLLLKAFKDNHKMKRKV